MLELYYFLISFIIPSTNYYLTRLSYLKFKQNLSKNIHYTFLAQQAHFSCLITHIKTLFQFEGR